MDPITLYVIPFLRALSLSVLAGWLLSRILGSLHIEMAGKYRYGRRFGGVVLIIIYCIAVVRDEHLVMSLPVWMILGSLLACMTFGVADDLLRFSWAKQLSFQVMIAGVLFTSGVAITSIGSPWGTGGWSFHMETWWWFSALISVGWLLLIVNAINWVDGVDGVAGGVSFVGFLAIFLLSLRPEVDQPPVAILSLIAAGTTLGFLFFNMPPSRFIAGTSGSYFWGFLLAALSIFAGTKIATTLLVLVVPIIDALWVIFKRLSHHASPFQGDTRYHLHYRLRERGWSDQAITFSYLTVTIAVGLSAPFLSSMGKTRLLVGAVVVIVFFLAYLGKENRSNAI